MEFISEMDVENTGDDKQKKFWTLNTELFPYEDNGSSFNQMESRESVR